MQRYPADITCLDDEFQRRFEDFAINEKEFMFLSSPLSVDPVYPPGNLKLELIELQTDDECRSRQQQLSLIYFYRQPDKEIFQEIQTFAKKMLYLFGSTYLCEQAFSVIHVNKNRVRTILSDSPE